MVMGALAKGMFGGRSPSPGGSGGGLGDILGDILGGGRAAPQPRQAQVPPGCGGLEDILKEILGGDGARPQAPQGGGQPNLDDILKDIFGGGGAAPGRVPPQMQEEAARRGRTTIDDALGRSRSSGNAADDLLNSVENAVRRR